jgi:hypothetical protein
MKAIEFKEQNCVFKGPAGSDIKDLPAFNTGKQIISKWELSDEEIEQINKTKCFYFAIHGPMMPPVHFTVENPFFEYKHPFAFSLVEYKTPTRIRTETPPKYKKIFVNGHFAIPTTFKYDGETYYLKTLPEEAKPNENFNITENMWCWCLIKGQLKLRYISTLTGDWVDSLGVTF